MNENDDPVYSPDPATGDNQPAGEPPRFGPVWDRPDGSPYYTTDRDLPPGHPLWSRRSRIFQEPSW